MLVSIVTVFYNRANHVKSSIQSLLNQSYTNIEIIAYDDGSTDGTYEQLCAIHDKRLKVYTHNNQGFTKSLIQAIQSAQGDIIAIHDSGDVSLPQRIEKQLQALQANPKVGLVSCYYENVDELTNARTLKTPSIDDSKNLTDQLSKANKFSHGEVMFRRSIYEQVGGYRAFFVYAQDYDLWLRMSLSTQFAIVPEILYQRMVFQESVRNSPQKKMIQKYLDELSVQCVHQRRNGQLDLIETYGSFAFLFRQKSKRLSRIFYIEAQEYLNHELYDEAMTFIRRSMEESLTEKNIKIYLKLLVIFKAPWLKPFIKSSSKVKK